MPQKIINFLLQTDGNAPENSRHKILSCATCGRLFVPTRKGRKYCSKPCWHRSDAKRKTIRQRFRDGKYNAAMRKNSERMKINNPMKRPEVRYQQAKTMAAAYASGKCVPFMSTPEGRKRIGEIARARALGPDNPMRNPETMKRNLAKALAHPNQFEKRVSAFLSSHQFPFKFTGDASFWIGPCLSGGHRNPDFVNSKKKLAILAHGRHWHQDPVKVEKELEDYRTMGWRCLVIWDNDKLDEAMLKNIGEFVGQE